MSYCENKLYRETLRTARKPHKCCETGRWIQPGEKYWEIFIVYDGASTFKQSEAAYHFARFLNGIHKPDRHWEQEECIPFGHVGGWIRDSQDPDYIAEWELVCRGIVTRNIKGERINAENAQ